MQWKRDGSRGWDDAGDYGHLWAAAELWVSTGDAAALADFESHANAGTRDPSGTETSKVDLDFDWSSLKNLGTFPYLTSARTARSSALVDTLGTLIVKHAKTLLAGRDVGGSSGSALDWADDQANHDVSEAAINWNGALVFALAGFLQPAASRASGVAGAAGANSVGGNGGHDDNQRLEAGNCWVRFGSEWGDCYSTKSTLNRRPLMRPSRKRKSACWLRSFATAT